MAMIDIAAGAAVTADVATPRSKPSLFNKPFLPALAGRVGAWLSARLVSVIRVGDTVIVMRHADVREVLERDLEFCIAPINAARIDEVNGPFILGMDRGHILDHERTTLYRAFHQVDMAALRDQVQAEARRRIAGVRNRTIDAVGDFARPIAAQTARRLALPDPGHDLMGQLIRLQQPGTVDAELVRRTLGGMLVGAIDTTTSCVAKIITVLGRDRALAAEVARDVDQPERLR